MTNKLFNISWRGLFVTACWVKLVVPKTLYSKPFEVIPEPVTFPFKVAVVVVIFVGGKIAIVGVLLT